MRQVQVLTGSQPREASGQVTIGGAVLAGFGAFSLWHMRLEERAAVRLVVRKRIDSVASTSAAGSGFAAGDEEDFYPHERRGSGVS
jgi:hypothetical protein